MCSSARGERDDTACMTQLATRPGVHYDTIDQACDTATTWPATSHNTAPCGRCLGAVRAACACSRGSGCAPGAPNPVLDLVHCFQSLFGPLFMNTVHEYYSQEFSKNKNKNKIK